MKRCRRIVGAALALLLGSALLVLLFALWPAPVINAVARYGLGLELSVGTIDYRVHNGRLLCHIQQLSYRHSPPALDLKLEHLAVDVNLKRLRNKHIIVNDLAVIGADLAIEQGGATPWWREFTAASPSAPEGEHASDTQWRLNVRSIQGKDIHLRVDLLLQQRQNALRITRLSSGQSPHQKRWLQIRGAINDYPLHVDGQVMAIGSKLDRIDPFDISWEVRLADAFLRADGRVDPFHQRGDTDVRVELDATTLPQIAAMLGLELPPFDAAAVSMNIIDAGTDFALDNIAINLRSDNTAIMISGSVAQPLQQWSPDLQVSADVNSMQTLLSRLGITMPTDFYARAQGQLVRSDGLLELRKLRGGIAFSGFEIPSGHQFGIADATLTLLKDEITGWQGPFELPLSIQGGRASIGLKSADEVLFYELPISQLAMQIRGDGMDLAGQAAYKQRPIDIDFSMADRWQTLAGEIRTLHSKFTLQSDFTRPWLPLDFTVAVDNLVALNDWLRLDFPENHALSASGSVRIAAGQPLSLHNFRGRVDHSGSLTLRMPHYRLAAQGDAQLELDLALPSTGATVPLLNALIDYANTERWRYTLHDLSTSAADRDLVSQELIPVQPEQLLQDYPWLEGSLEASLSLRSSGEQRAIDHIELDFAGQDLTLQTRGALSKESTSLDGELQFGLGLAAQPEAGRRADLKARGRLLWQDNTLLAEGLEVSSTPASRMRVNLSLADPLGEHPRLIADVYSDQWDLRPWFGKDQAAASGAAQQSPSTETGQAGETPRLFSAMPWRLGFLHRFDGLLSLNMRQLQLRGFSLDHLRTDISLHDGELNISPLSIAALDGSVVAAFSRQLQHDTSQWRLQMRIEDIDAAHYQTVQDDNREAPPNQGRVSALIDLTSQGDSTREVMTHLSGRVTEHISDMIIYGVDLDLLASNVLRQILELLNPFQPARDGLVKTHIECQVGHALFGDGLMYIDRSMLMRTPSSTFVLSWFVDFATEQQRLQVIPRLRRGIALSTTDLARTAQLSGTLLQPRLVANTGGLFLVGAGSAALYATGGWLYYFAWRQLERALARTDGCERAVGKYFRQDPDDLKLPVRTAPLPDYATEPQSSR